MQNNETKIIDIASLGMWLFIASEAMFFVALLGAFVVLQSTGPQHQLFARSSQMLVGWMGIASVILLLISSGMLMPRRGLALAAAVLFLALQFAQWGMLLRHHTIVSQDSGRAFVVDGFISSIGGGYMPKARQIDLPTAFDIHNTTAADFASGRFGKAYVGDPILQDLNYGPSRNNYFASYFLMSALHSLHLIAGMIALLWILLFRKGKLPAALQNYWHFVNLVGIIGLATLYFV